jgi:hypothetical protein
MSPVPADPKIYHITHLRNLPEILQSDCLWSDAKRLELGLDCEIVGMSAIKQRRLEEIEVDCNPGTKVGEYVPFYFCPRSIMLYILHMGNHIDIKYREGQRPIVHLQADLMATIRWAKDQGIRWAFSDRNAGTYYTNFYHRVKDLNKVNWAAVQSNDFKDMIVKDGKQAEFLVWETFPWHLIEKIGVHDANVADKVNKILDTIGYADRPAVSVEPVWYY